MTHVSATFSQVAFRHREDDGSETGATWIAAENVGLTDLDVSTNRAVRTRVAVQETAGGANNNLDLTIQYRRNEGAWLDVNASTVAVIFRTSPFVADQTPTTDQLSTPAGTFAGGAFVSASGSEARISFEGNDHGENEYSLELVAADLDDGDVLEFRLLGDGAVLSSYPETPTITVAKAVVEEDHFAGGSTSSISVSTSGEGSADEAAAGGSTASVTVTATGDGTADEAASGGSTASVVVTATGEGFADEASPEDHFTGGSTASISGTTTGDGNATETATGGSEASIVVTSTGDGVALEDAAGGSSPSIVVTSTGDGTATETASGGSTAGVVVTATGGGFATIDGDPEQHHSGGSTASIVVTTTGDGAALEEAAGGSSTAISATATGEGSATETASGGSTTSILVTATGEGSADVDPSEQHHAGGSTATVLVAVSGAGTALEDAAGGSIALVAVTATGEGRDSTPSGLPPSRILGATIVDRRPSGTVSDLDRASASPAERAYAASLSDTREAHP